MNFTANITNDFLNVECPGDYLSVGLGVMFLLSEMMGMYQPKKHQSDVVVDIGGNEIEVEKEKSFLENSNGLIHSLLLLSSKFKK